MVISITHSGYIKSLPLSTYRQQRRGGVGVTGMDMKDDDYIEHLFVTSTHDYLLFFTNRGKVYRLKVYELPEASRTAKGRALVNLLPLREGERVQSVLSTRDFTEGKYLVFATRDGIIKKTEFLAYNTPIKADGIIAINIRDDDELIAVRRTSGHDDIIMVSRSGPGGAVQRGRGARDGPRHQRRARHERLAEGQRRAVDGRRPGRSGAPRRDRERLRQAHADLRVPGQGPRHDGRQDDHADREQGRSSPALSSSVSTRSSSSSPRTAWSSARRCAGINRYGRASQGVRVMNIRDDDQVSAVALVVESEAATAAPRADDAVDTAGRLLIRHGCRRRWTPRLPALTTPELRPRGRVGAVALHWRPRAAPARAGPTLGVRRPASVAP